MARRRRRPTPFLAILLRHLKARRRKNATARRIAQKKATTAQKVIIRDSRTTAGELRKTGALQWAGDGMADSTVMEPVLEKGRHTGEWVPAKTQPRKRANSLRGGTPRSGKTVARPPAVPGMMAVRDARGWSYVPKVANDSAGPMVEPGATTAGALRAKGHPFNAWVRDDQPVIVYPDGRVHVLTTESAQHAQKCGAPTKDKTPCERLGDCPIRSHQTWRKANSR